MTADAYFNSEDLAAMRDEVGRLRVWRGQSEMAPSRLRGMVTSIWTALNDQQIPTRRVTGRAGIDVEGWVHQTGMFIGAADGRDLAFLTSPERRTPQVKQSNILDLEWEAQPNHNTGGGKLFLSFPDARMQLRLDDGLVVPVESNLTLWYAQLTG